jgi:AcrR family transcriptional regulator
MARNGRNRDRSNRIRTQAAARAQRRVKPALPERDDRATRERVREAARRLFVERGFQKVSVREITEEAHANIAAVSYHFRDKLGLYMEVLQEAIVAAREGFEATKAPEGSPPEERLRHFVRANIQRLAEEHGGRLLIQQLMRHEMMDPTPALPFILEQASLPRMRYLAGIVSELLSLSPNDPTVGLYVLSIHAQFIFQMKSALRDQFFGEWQLNTLSPERVADHIVDFTLGAIRAVVRSRRPV